MCRDRQGTGESSGPRKGMQTGYNHHLHQRPSCELEDDIGQSWTQSKVRRTNQNTFGNLHKLGPGVVVETGNEMADEWAKLAADEPTL